MSYWDIECNGEELIAEMKTLEDAKEWFSEYLAEENSEWPMVATFVNYNDNDEVIMRVTEEIEPMQYYEYEPLTKSELGLK